MIGFVVGVPLSLVVIAAWRAERIPPLTAEKLQEARHRWKMHGAPHYTIAIDILGKRAGRVVLVEEDGKPVSMTRDGATPARRETWQAWNVAGMFDTIEQELELAARPQQAFGVEDPGQVVLRCRFDARYGYPIRYQRIVLGSDNELGWRVVSFEPRQNP